MVRYAGEVMAAQLNENSNQQVWGKIMVNVLSFGADPTGNKDSTSSIQKAINYAKEFNGYVYFPPGIYLISSSLKLNTSADPLKPIIGIALVGSYGVPSYNSEVMPSIIRASSSFLAGEPLIDARYSKGTTISNLSIYGKYGLNGTVGIEYGERDSSGRSYSNHRIEWCSIHNHQIGIKSNSAGLFHIAKNNISSCYQSGIGFLSYSGDSDFEGNFINTCNVDFTGTENHIGCGIFLGSGSSNINIRGGKIEWCAKGIVISSSNGVNISDVNFDVNKWSHIYIEPFDSNVFTTMGININGNRFLSGGTFAEPNGRGQSHIVISNVSGAKSSVTISGNSFKSAGLQAYDTDTTPPVGPALYCVKIFGGGQGSYTISGNTMIDGSLANTLSVYGSGNIVYLDNNATNLPNDLESLSNVVLGKFGNERNITLATSMPNSGSYKANDFVQLFNPQEKGTTGNKYVVQGYHRLTTGSGHVLNTDWLELRLITGN